MRPLIPFLAAATALLAASAATAKTTPAEREKAAHAQQVLGQIQELDARLERTIQAWDGANIRLAALERQVRANRAALARARRTLRVARAQLAQRLVAIYQNGEPSALDVVLEAKSLAQAIDELRAAEDVVGQDRRIARQAAVAAHRFAVRQRALARARTRQRATLAQLTATRGRIEDGLAQRRRLLASIRTQIATLQAQERARERMLAAQARARIAREERRLAAERAAARARAERARSTVPAPARAAQPTPVAPATTSAPTPPPAPAPPPIPVPQPAPGGGHPEAAAIAARYLGVPYRWGGATPAGFDCSGLVAYVYAQLGIALPHYTVAQWNATQPIARGDLQPGDLVFFDGLSHVGIYIGGNQFIHAPHTGDVVRVSSLGESWYASHFDGARRVP
jgi:cell wall-associated NlpC family hydrolase